MAKNHGETSYQGDDVVVYDEDVPISRELCRSALPSVFAVIAFFLAWIGSLGCEFVQFTLLPTTNYNNNATQNPITVHFGIWYRQSVEFYNYSDSNGGGGYYKVSTCTGYSDDNINIDPSWMAARAFSILVLILGGIALLLALATCCCANHVHVTNINRFNGGIYLLVTLFQGLTLIILSSKLCQNNDDIRQVMGQENVMYSFPDECNLSEGAKCIISATAFWFLAGILSCTSFRAGRKKMGASLVNTDTPSSVEPLLPS
eukprot:scaffold6831_cov144-Skeletonema_marinoi.AAC.1